MFKLLILRSCIEILAHLFYWIVSWDAEVDSDALFSNHTVEEIRAVEHKTRSVLENIRGKLYKYLSEACYMLLCTSWTNLFNL